MMNVDALHRRRNLFRVRLKDKYKKVVSNKTVVNEEAIVADGINRTKGENLIIDWIDSTTENIKN
jgi:hypothetical protein